MPELQTELKLLDCPFRYLEVELILQSELQFESHENFSAPKFHLWTFLNWIKFK